MFNDQAPAVTSRASHGGNDDDQIRDIHALTSPQPPPVTANRNRRGEAWETTSQRSTSMASEGGSSENFTSMSREFNALVIAGAEIGDDYRHDRPINEAPNNLSRIREEEYTPEEEMNPLAIVPDGHPFDDRLAPLAISRQENRRGGGGSGTAATREISLHMVKKEEVETKISAWQNAKIAKINNRFKREDAVISGWEREQVQKASSWMKKIERKLEEKRAKALEKMENEVAKAHRKAEERRASAEAKRGTKVAKLIEISNLMRAVGRPPAKRSFF
ncbi:remorin 4.1-like isoform X1 [Cucurbita pepo subsp. pepo]|uniref:remorin 4.1-like isoform X1 n=1 Tax=Cucurbita pepo subsp. pepo TaxID=3664 RepID=UPI000C9D5E33|nr:remorin 4.1-like isoform X1 [Cucurbita pepo subsp. pepo]XP_023526480.1 remorin 4.1-like isoform X1 [Cucurbita pepo subsp. pepo]